MSSLRRKLIRTRNSASPVPLAIGPWTPNLLCVFPGGWATSIPFYDPAGNLWTPSWASFGGPFAVMADGPHIKAVGIDGGSHSTKYTTSSFAIPTGDITIVFAAMNPVSNSGTGGGGPFGAESSGGAQALGCLFPFGTTIYFDYGGNSGAHRVNYTPAASFWGQWHIMGFRAGSLGSQIWADGILKVSQGTAITRTAGTGNFILGNDGLTSGTNWLDYSLGVLLMWDAWLPDALFTSLMANPYQVFQAPAGRLLFAGGASGGGPVIGSQIIKGVSERGMIRGVA